MNKLDLRKIIVFLLLIIAVFGLIFFSEWISFEALKENRAEIAEFRDKNFALSIISFWIFYVILVVFSLPGAAVASVSGGFLFGVVGMIIAIPLYTAFKVIGKVFFSENKLVKKLTKNL